MGDATAFSSMDEFCGSTFWDANETWWTTDPDFTPCFEQTVLVWAPCAFFWLFMLFDFWYLKASLDKNIPWNRLNISKLLINVGLLVVTALDLIMSFVKKGGDSELPLYGVDIWTPIIKLLTFLMVLMFIPLNRKYGVQTSGCQFMFWFLLTIFSIPRCRTEARLHQERGQIIGSQQAEPHDFTWETYQFASFFIFFAFTCLMLILNCFADQLPRQTKYYRGPKEIPELSASFLSRITYSWFDRMALKGYRNPLEEKDLWDLRPQDSCKEVMPTFAHYWNKNVRKNYKRASGGQEPKAQFSNGKVSFENPQSNGRKKGMASIMPPIYRSFGGIFLFGSFFKLITDILTFAQPQVLSLIIGYVEDFAKVPQPEWKGIMYSILLFVLASAQTFILAQYFHRMFIVGLRIRTALINCIYRKALRISNAARKASTVGEIVNLMAVDAQRFMDLTTYLNMLWSAPLQIALALYFLWQQLGPSVLAGLAVMIIMIPLNGFIASRIKTYQIRQMKYKDERVKLMNEVLSGIKVLKLYAWEPSFEKQVLDIRDKEIATLRATAYLNASTSFLWSCAPFLVSLVTFATYVLIDENNVLDAKKTFVSLSLFNILRFPLTMLPMLITNLVQTQVSVQRINKFLNSEELDPNNVQHDASKPHPMSIENGHFSWGDEDEMTLKNINMQVPKNNLVAIVGTVGSGKSSVIQALLGEMEKISGTVNTVGKMAYVPQQAWIQNATVRDNILFGKPYDRKRYNKVIDACALRTDIEILSAGDLTEVGEKGINLSGGQKQRISLARAVYHNADLYLLDDPLSAVDSHVGKHIFEEVIGPKGMLAKKTRVLVTHGITFLPQTDKIYVMKMGEISENGTYAELLKNRGAFADFLMQHLQEGEEEEEELNQIKRQLSQTDPALVAPFEKAILLARTESLSDSISVTSADSLMGGSLRRRGKRQDSYDSNASAASLKKKQEVEGKLIETEKSQTGGVDFAVYKHYIKSVGIFLSVATLVLNFVFQAFQIGSNLWLTQWSNDKAVEHDTGLRNMYLGVYGAFGFGQGVFAYIAVVIVYCGGLKAAKTLHNQLLNQVMRGSICRFFDITPLGRILNSFSADMDVIDEELPATMDSFMTFIFMVLATIVVISISTPIFLAVIVPIGFIYYFAQRFYVATSRQLMRLESVSRSPIYSHFGETVTGVSTIRAYTVQDRFIEESDNKVDKNQVCKYPSLIANRWLAVRLEMVGNLIILFASLFAVLGGQTNPGLVGLSVSYALQVTQTLNWLVRMSSDIETNIVSVERIKEYGETKQEAAWELEEDKKKPKNWPEDGRVEFKDFQVRYREGLELVLRGVSFNISGGQKVGIVGRTGAGKSSLTLALFRIIESAGGKILIDGIDIATMGLHMLRSRLTIIPQDPVLFSGSLRSNLDPFEVKTDDEIWKALELSHLKAFAKSLTAGLNHEISEGGENLSVGQRQLVCLARALLRKTKVLVLDEATAAVDLETDDLIQKTIRSEFRECTVLTIAHRLNTILDSDKVIVLDKGQITEFDAPSALLADPKSAFFSMAKDANLV
ncbi:multidrug resistance-associated protein 1 isoform X1 [Drosophila virilis]|uniref:ABC-type glutathione-S-conjugate transporter n=1 Tax=Drosophila virilis TaxID=7244 RepID=A0A0Q9WXE7_DROVI|nr:multidrug resistance-associated protein 1 isoform X1 [Drosophila virilis]XP_015024530.1 multidrug resistance-associated protein 1 isoform X1 [Drosophila virilis]KRF85613.1 uncharacterized protein Dvir_GJ16281, isoform C [Drosophila virilis]KRF85627.1 uncharacterized protein Dvir_GJ16281, isoform R [Drosophila virilis]KRF85631.1 uncharacterized protein Dvir_GJ16281, isoform V [Drosophila virilis]